MLCALYFVLRPRLNQLLSISSKYKVQSTKYKAQRSKSKDQKFQTSAISPDQLLCSTQKQRSEGEIMFRRIIATSPTWFTLPLRLAMAAVFIAHGAQKVLGSWEGPGFSKFIAASAPYPFMKPSWLWMGAAALSELIGGVLLLFGFLTRIGAFFLACTMLVAVLGVHWPKFFAANRGFEYPLSLLAMSLALLISGGGIASIDLALTSGGRRR